MRIVAIALGTTMAIGGAWIMSADDARVDEGVVLTRSTPPPREAPIFTEASSAFGGADGSAAISEPSDLALPTRAQRAPAERIVGEAELRLITRTDIARMQAIGIGMNIGGMNIGGMDIDGMNIDERRSGGDGH